MATTTKTRSARKAPVKNAKADTTATSRKDLALSILVFNGEATNVANMLFMSRGDNYVEYAKLIVGVDAKGNLKSMPSYRDIRTALEADLVTVADKDGKIGAMSYKAKAHSLAVGIKKTVEKREVKFNKEGKAEATLFSKFDKKTDKEVTKIVKVTQKSVFKAYNSEEAIAFLARFK